MREQVGVDMSDINLTDVSKYFWLFGKKDRIFTPQSLFAEMGQLQRFLLLQR